MPPGTGWRKFVCVTAETVKLGQAQNYAQFFAYVAHVYINISALGVLACSNYGCRENTCRQAEPNQALAED
jgi:hypothetical protein